jgi:hypothetical protein
MDVDSLPESMKLIFKPNGENSSIAHFGFGEYLIVGPNFANEFMVAFSLYQDGGENVSYTLEERPKTYRAAKYIAQKFHVNEMIPKIVQSFEVQNASETHRSSHNS